MKRLKENEQYDRVSLEIVGFLIQIHNPPIGFHASKFVKDIGEYVNTFMEMDENNFTGTWRNYPLVWVSIDINKPLKRRMQIKKLGSEWLWVEFRYERLLIFCSILWLLRAYR